jgi:hypothetical protein
MRWNRSLELVDALWEEDRSMQGWPRPSRRRAEMWIVEK